MNTFIQIYTKANKAVYINISQIIQIEPGSDQGARITLGDGRLIETSQKLEEILKKLDVL